MDLNGTSLTDRHNNPSVIGPVAIKTRFYLDGQPKEPYDVSSVTIFSKLTNASPNSIVDATTGIIKADQPISTVLMNFAISGGIGPTQHGPHNAEKALNVIQERVTQENLEGSPQFLAWFPPYSKSPQASGIYRTNDGEVGTYVAVLAGGAELSGAFGGGVGSTEGGTEIPNGASSVQEYIDVWTVKMQRSLPYQLFINTFKLSNTNYLSIPEPLLLTPSNRLVNKHVTLGSTVDLKITTAMTVNNKNLDEATKNILQDYSIAGASVKIQKINEGSTSINPHEEVTVGGFVDATTVTGDNTIIYSFILDEIPTLVGGQVGTYAITAKYDFIGETIVTPPFYFSVS
jgi:hypothetical protein